MQKCSMRKSCFFYGAYKDHDEDRVPSWVKKYCHNELNAQQCARHEYVREKSATPPADYGPTGELAQKRNENV
ncbi:MAG: hypothetical protein P9L92_03910 [Candidatus Electryonea clarkiae]|nr:hypothetical protein [Candidatus Electryonea clarkiae]